MTDIPDEIMAKAREVVAKFPTPPDNRNECVKTIAAALLSERNASEAALKEARVFASSVENYSNDPHLVREARAFLAKTGGA